MENETVTTMTPEAMKAAPMGWYEVAARLQGNPMLDERVCTSLEVVMSDAKTYSPVGITKVGFMLIGAPYKSGKRKGEKRYVKGSTVYAYVTRAEVTAAMASYEAATGKCADCKDGQEFHRWSVEKGTETRACRKCAGSGAAQRPAAATGGG